MNRLNVANQNASVELKLEPTVLSLVPPLSEPPPIALAEVERDDRSSQELKLISWPGMALICWLMSALVGMTGFSGWLAGPRAFASFGGKFIPIAHSEATFFMIMGFTLVFYVYGTTRKLTKPLAAASMITTSLFCLLKLVEFLGDAEFGIESIFNLQLNSFLSFVAGTMSPVSALTFLCMCLSLFLLVIVSDQRKRTVLIATALTSVSIVATVGIIMGYVTGSPLMYSGTIIPMSLPAAIAFLLLEAGTLIAIGPAYAPLQLILGRFKKLA